MNCFSVELQPAIVKYRWLLETGLSAALAKLWVAEKLDNSEVRKSFLEFVGNRPDGLLVRYRQVNWNSFTSRLSQAN